MEAPAFRVDRIDRAGDHTEFRFVGRLSFRDLYASWSEVRDLLRSHPPSVSFDLSGVETLDGGATALLLELKSEVQAKGAEADIVGAEGRVRAMLELYGHHPPRPCLQDPPKRIGILDQIGREVLTSPRATRSPTPAIWWWPACGRCARRSRSIGATWPA